MYSQFKKYDEFAIFKEVVTKFKEIQQDLLLQIYDSLPENKKIFFKEVVGSVRIETNEGKTEARRIVKVKGRKNEPNQ